MPRLAVLILALLLAVPAFAQEEAARVDKLIQNLASQDWATRERASRELVGIGEPARAALRKALEHDDPEVRVRASNALVAIGEEFAYAVECATAESESLRDHGRAALMNLFKLDDPKVLREFTQRELQPQWRGWNEQLNVMAPPAIALARLQALSGARILVAEDARESWARVLGQPTANIQVQGSPEQIPFLRDAVQRFLQQALGSLSADNQLVPRPLRLGRATVLYITRASDGTGITRRCSEQLLDDLLKEGEQSARAAALLADGAASDSDAVDRIRRQYAARPDLSRLMWLALALGADDATTACVRAREHADAAALLKARDWIVLELGAKYLECLDPAPRGALLSPLVENSADSLELLSALWVARGAVLSDAARARAGRLLKSRQDMLSAAAARWFAGAGDVSDEELAAIWQAGEFQPLNSSFFTAALELVQRPDIADRLAEAARRSFAATFDPNVSRHALAASVLIGRATPDDLAVALDKLTAARASQRMVNQLAEMFSGCTTLPEGALSKFQAKLFDSDVSVRRVYLAALRRCDSALQVSIARAGIEAHDAKDDKHVGLARLSLLGILAGAGDAEALDEVIKAVEGEDIELAKAGGAAYADALQGEALFKALEELNGRQGVTHGAIAALEGYMEICRRASAGDDRATFRKAYGIAIGMQILNRNWQLRQELMLLQQQLGSGEGKVEKHRSLPADPILKQLNVDEK